MTRFNTIVPTESEEQQALFRCCAVEMSRYPDLDMLVHTPNEGKRSISQGAKLKREGLRKGFPDISLCVPKGQYHGLYIELKRRRGYNITSEQKDWIIKLNRQGYAAAFCFGWEEAWEFIHAYLTCHIVKRYELVEKYIKKSLEAAKK